MSLKITLLAVGLGLSTFATAARAQQVISTELSDKPSRTAASCASGSGDSVGCSDSVNNYHAAPWQPIIPPGGNVVIAPRPSQPAPIPQPEVPPITSPGTPDVGNPAPVPDEAVIDNLCHRTPTGFQPSRAKLINASNDQLTLNPSEAHLVDGWQNFYFTVLTPQPGPRAELRALTAGGSGGGSGTTTELHVGQCVGNRPGNNQTIPLDWSRITYVMVRTRTTRLPVFSIRTN